MGLLYELIKPYSSIATIGMCKNAGKTTVLNSLIEECFAHGETPALTSIGRDGERSDVVTSTKKPEIFVYDGTIIATAEALLCLGDISREVLDTTGMPTPMGEVVIMRSCSDGLVQIAGPSMTAQLKSLKARLFALGAKRVFIDGALSRKSLAMPAVSDCCILSSGASYARDMRKTVEDTAHSAALMSLEKTARFDAGILESGAYEEKFIALDEEGKPIPLQGAKEAAELIRAGGVSAGVRVRAMLARGGVTDSVFEALFAAGKQLSGLELVIEDGSRLLVRAANYQKLLRAGACVKVLDETRLAAVTVNPFSAYGEHYDKNAFFDAVRVAIPAHIPVVNVKDCEYA